MYYLVNKGNSFGFMTEYKDRLVTPFSYPETAITCMKGKYKHLATNDSSMYQIIAPETIITWEE